MDRVFSQSFACRGLLNSAAFFLMYSRAATLNVIVDSCSVTRSRLAAFFASTGSMPNVICSFSSLALSRARARVISG